jgi:4-hydroxymandelate oxidase
MNFDLIKSAARERLLPGAWDYYQGVADDRPDADTDHDAWERIQLVPRVLHGLVSVDTTAQLGTDTVATPIMVSATAAHGLADPEAELATAAAAAAAGALMVYSSNAAIEVTEFGAAAQGPWWAQVYIMEDRHLTEDYLRRIVVARPSAVVLTVDHMGALAEAPFRIPSEPLPARPGNFPGMDWREMGLNIEPGLVPDDIRWIADITGLPVFVKGVLHPDDAVIAVEAGAAGIVVSNHGRRQVAGVVPTAEVLPEVVAAVAGAVPVLVDGGIRSGIDVLRAIAIGAAGVGVGRPVLWGLAATGTAGVTAVLDGLKAELRQAMAAVGAASLEKLLPSTVRLPR